MRIGLSVQGMIGQRVDGGRRYSVELLKSLVPLVKKLGHEVIIFCSDGDDQIIAQMALGCRIIPISDHSGSGFIFRSVRRGLKKLNLLSPRNLEWHAKNTKVDFIHFFGFPDYSYTGPCVVTLHCLQHEYFPEFFENASERSSLYKKMLERADLLITNSTYTANSIKECFGKEYNNKVVIPAPLGGCNKISISNIESQKIIEKYNINNPYLIYPSSNLRNKNHLRLLEAFSILIHIDKIAVSLVLTGFQNYPMLMWNVKRLNLRDNVFVLGKVPDNDLNILIKNSICMPFISLFEGFGLPVVEAMALGTPVVCSNVASLPEVGGDAVLYVDPLSVEDITDKLKMVIQNGSLRTGLSEAGKKQAAKFTWERCAKETYQAYEQMKNIVFKGG